jgi:F-type H+-transporting ATPase subunit c
LATTSIAGTGVGIGVIFSGLINAYSRTPEHVKQLFFYAILGFALTEAIALLGLMIVFLILFS